MTGIALALTDIPKIALGTTEIAKVSLGTVDVWPAPPSTPTYIFRTEVVGSTVAARTIQLNFYGEMAVPSRGIAPALNSGAALVLNEHPITWYSGGGNGMFCKWQLISRSGPAASTFVMDSSVGQFPENVWTDVVGGFESMTGRMVIANVVGSPGPTSRFDVRIQLSLTANGGNIVYDAISRFEGYRV